MSRLTTLVLALGLVAGAANAAEIKVSAAGKSPAELRAAVSQAAFSACKTAYNGEVFAYYEREACVTDTVKTVMAKVQLGVDTAKAARPVDVAAAGH
jgi:gamma-glutamyl:cysteine ligase YbdK (ATP-grasp superfamily)